MPRNICAAHIELSGLFKREKQECQVGVRERGRGMRGIKTKEGVNMFKMFYNKNIFRKRKILKDKMNTNFVLKSKVVITSPYTYTPL